jgi:hypothetical protein
MRTRLVRVCEGRTRERQRIGTKESIMAEIGAFLSSEEHGPASLVASEAG